MTDSSKLFLVATNAALLVALGYVLWRQRGGGRPQPRTPQAGDGDGGPLTAYLDKNYVPPLPQPVADVLAASCLCFLATSSELAPHLSLMRFTYCRSLTEEGAEVLIISTRRNTKKYSMLLVNRQVALLVHEFSNDDTDNYAAGRGGRMRYSVTLNGVVDEQQGELAARYRAIHLRRNAAYAQFIEGDDIAIITVKLTSATVCDVTDSVTHFKYSKQAGSWRELGTSPPAPAASQPDAARAAL